jgi:hypothetical protein
VRVFKHYVLWKQNMDFQPLVVSFQGITMSHAPITLSNHELTEVLKRVAPKEREFGGAAGAFAIFGAGGERGACGFGLDNGGAAGGDVGFEPRERFNRAAGQPVGVGAVFLDGGWDAAVRAVERLLAPELADATQGDADPRMALQEWSHANHQKLPVYVSPRTGGTDHLPEFTSTVTAGDRSATGTGVSRKKAEAAAAAALLELLKQP